MTSAFANRLCPVLSMQPHPASVLKPLASLDDDAGTARAPRPMLMPRLLSMPPTPPPLGPVVDDDEGGSHGMRGKCER